MNSFRESVLLCSLGGLNSILLPQFLEYWNNTLTPPCTAQGVVLKPLVKV